MLIFQEPSKKKRLELPEKEKRQRDQVDKILGTPFLIFFLNTHSNSSDMLCCLGDGSSSVSPVTKYVT